MTILAAIRCLTFLARDVFEAALYLIPAPGGSGDDVDGADTPWWVDELVEREAAVDVTEGSDFAAGLEEFANGERVSSDWLFEDDCCLGGDFSFTAGDAPTPPDHPSYPQTNESNLDRITVLLEDIRNLLQHNAPVASASPPTPADATGSDPAAVHERHMRRLLGEDNGRP